MNLPEFERVIYARNPLIEVIGQLRFPPILKITHQDPTEFQDEIRLKYPFFGVAQPEVPSEITKIAQKLNLPLPAEKSYIFQSEDLKWQLSLARDFIVLSTLEYKRYEQFKERFQEVLIIFEHIYKPSFYTRLGLRYRDLIIRSALKLDDKKWSDLLQKHISLEFHDPFLSQSLDAITKNMHLTIESGQVNFNHGMVIAQNQETNKNEESYVLDSDFYTEQKIEENENVWKIFDDFNQSARQLFRWSITDTLHNAMQPQSPDII